jgi:hypothetical protein
MFSIAVRLNALNALQRVHAPPVGAGAGKAYQ